MKLHRGMLALAVVSLVCGGAFAQSPKVGAMFPNFEAKELVTGKKLSMKNLRGKVVVVDFWATWCRPCVAEIPNVKKVYEEFKDQGLEIVSISLDRTPGECRRYVQENRMKWLHVSEGGTWKTRLAKKYRINSIPAMYVVGRDGKVVAEKVRGHELRAAVEEALKAEPPADAKDADDKAGDDDKAGSDDSKDADGSASDDDGGENVASGGEAAMTSAKVDREASLTAEQTRWLKVARSMKANQNYELARSYYNRIIEKYPGSTASEIAREELKMLKN